MAASEGVAAPNLQTRSVSDCFATDYASAREAFRSVCEERNLPLQSYIHPQPGPGGEELAVDTALAGPRDSRNLVIVISGTHGLEGLAGSGCQLWWLRQGLENLPHDLAVLHIHMLNPWGAAWGRRQTEDNVDLNRNFMDFSQPAPDNPHYEALREALHCPEREGPAYERSVALRNEYAKKYGDGALASAIFGGQYSDPLGIGFGGKAPTWSNRTYRQILSDYAGAAQNIAIIDLHTGLGPYGHGMLINTSPAGSNSLRLAQSWYGHNLTAIGADPSKIPYELHGDLCAASADMLSSQVVVPVALEFGTFEVSELLQNQVDACWLNKQTQPHSEAAQAVQSNLWRFFYPASRDWFQMLCFRSQQVISMAQEGLRSDGC